MRISIQCTKRPLSKTRISCCWQCPTPFSVNLGSNIRMGNNYLLHQCMECVFFGSHFDFTDGWSEVWNQEISRAPSHQLTAKLKMAFKEKQIISNLCLNNLLFIQARCLPQASYSWLHSYNPFHSRTTNHSYKADECLNIALYVYRLHSRNRQG